MNQKPAGGAPDRIGPYVIRHPLGRGATGVTYAAVHERDERKVALKIVPPQRVAKDPEQAAKRFAEAARTLRGLQNPGVVRVLDAGRAKVPSLGDCFYLAMEQLEGESLAAALRRGPFFAPEAVRIAIDIAQVVQALHQVGVVHGDLRPATVFVTREPRVVLTEFGLLRFDAHALKAQRGAFASSAPYLAPEQLLEGRCEARGDVFALGALLYTLLSCSLLRPISSAADLWSAVQRGEEVQRLAQVQGLEPALVKVLRRALATDPAQRFASASALAAALQPLAGALPARYPDRVAAPMPRFSIPDEQLAAFLLPGLGEAQASAAAGSQPGLAPVSAPQLDPRAVMDFVLAEKPVNHAIDDETAAIEAAPQMLANLDASSQKRSHKVAEALALDYFGRTDELVSQLNARNQAAAAPQSPAAPIHGDLAPLDPRLQRPIEIRRVPRLLVALGVLGVLALAGGVAALWLTRAVELHITSTPSGAQVLLDGRIAGTTPARLRTPRLRRVEIALQAPGFAETRQAVVPRDLPGLALHLELPVAPASLSVQTLPAGALLTVDGRAICRTPCTAAELSPERVHAVAVEREGCEPTRLLLKLQAGETTSRDLQLKALSLNTLSLLQIFADEQALYLDGAYMHPGAERVEFFAVPGKHTLQLGVAGEPLAVAVTPAGIQRLDLRRERQAGAQPRRDRDDGRLTREIEAEAEVVLAVGLAIDGKVREARRAVETALAMDPNSPRALRVLIALAARAGDRDQVLQHIDTFVARAVTEPDLELVRSVGAALRGETTCHERE